MQVPINATSKVILVSNLPSMSHVTVSHLYNLFSCFGNIRAILYLRNKGKCFVEFTNLLFAQSCQTLANLQFFMGQKLKISFSNRKKIKPASKSNNQSKKYNEFKKINKKGYRFGKYDNILIPMPSDSVIIIGIPLDAKKPISHENVFFLLRKMKFKPKKILILKGHKRKLLINQFKNYGKIQNLEKSLISVYQYNNISEAMNIISQAHGVSNDSIRLDLSFSFIRC